MPTNGGCCFGHGWTIQIKLFCAEHSVARVKYNLQSALYNVIPTSQFAGQCLVSGFRFIPFNSEVSERAYQQTFNCPILLTNPVRSAGNFIILTFAVRTTNRLITQVVNLDYGRVQAGEIHNLHVEMYTRHRLDHDGAFIFFTFYHGFGGGCSFHSKYVFSIGNQHVSSAVFMMKKVSDPSRNSLSTDVFHGHTSDPSKRQNKFHDQVVIKGAKFKCDFSVSRAVSS